MPTPLPRGRIVHLLALVFAITMWSGCQAAHPPAGQVRPARPNLSLADIDFVQFRWEDSSATSQQRYVEPMNAQRVALGDSVVLDIRGIDSATVWPERRDSSDWDVVLRLSRSGAAQFGATTATHVGRRLAVLVDGSITEMPLVQGPLGARALLVSHVSRHVADSLATRVNRAVTSLKPFGPVVFPRDSARKGTRFPPTRG